MAASAAGFLLAAAAADRYPLSVWLVLVGVVVPSLGVGFALDRFRWTLLGLAYLPIVIAATALADERRGTVAAVTLGDPAARVRSVLGQAPRRDPTGGLGPLDESGDSFHGPSVLPAFHNESNLAYKKLFFAADARGVRYLEVIDRRARLLRGVGPGDSISLFRRAYPRMKCDEGDAGEDEPIPFPRCHGWTAPHVYMYVAGDYSKPGTPITEIWLADFDLVKGER